MFSSACKKKVDESCDSAGKAQLKDQLDIIKHETKDAKDIIEEQKEETLEMVFMNCPLICIKTMAQGRNV